MPNRVRIDKYWDFDFENEVCVDGVTTQKWGKKNKSNFRVREFEESEKEMF